MMVSATFESGLMWTPPNNPKLAINRLKRVIEEKYGQKFKNYDSFHRWSCDNYADFWAEVWNFCGVKASKRWDNSCHGKVVDPEKRIDEIPEWFRGSRLNYAENLLCRGDPDKVAIYFIREDFDLTKDIRRLTFGQLRSQVQKYAAALRKAGIGCGDEVAGYMPNCIECTVAMLAAASIGAVWSSTSADFGHMGVLERFNQVKPKVLFSVEAVRYNGKRWDHMDKLGKVVQDLPSLQTVIMIPFLSENESDIDISTIPHCIFLSEFLQNGTKDGVFPLLQFEQVPFNHPLFIMFSSGTTGSPKCMVHSVGGTLLKHMQEHIIQECLTSNDVMFFWTTVGWMMWNWAVSSLAAGAAVVLFDGSPFEPNISIIFDIIDAVGVTYMGMGAKCYAVYEEKGLKPKNTHRLESLKGMLSTGSPLKAASFDYIYSGIKANILIGSISGGTDIIACFMGATWLKSVYRGECQALYLGMDMQAWDDDGKTLEGERGELVCLKPFPSMPTNFLDDPEGLRYQKAYFNKYQGVWAHSDYCVINPETGGVVMLGRSDGTLNPGGVRFGSAEIYHVVESFPEVNDSVCVGQRLKDNDERVILFLKMNPNYVCDDAFVKQIKASIRKSMSPKHVPAFILPVNDIPYTTSGKKVEVAVRRLLSGETIENRNALRNPESLHFFENIKELAL